MTDEFIAHVKAGRGSRGRRVGPRADLVVPARRLHAARPQVGAAAAAGRRSRTRRTSPCSRRATCSSPGSCSTARSSRSRPCSSSGWRGSRCATPGRSGLEERYAGLLPGGADRDRPRRLRRAGRQGAGAQARARGVAPAHPRARRSVVREQAELVVDRLRRTGTMTFRALCGDAPDTLTTVARFLALLELFRENAVAFDQVSPAGRADRALDRRRRPRRRWRTSGSTSSRACPSRPTPIRRRPTRDHDPDRRRPA